MFCKRFSISASIFAVAGACSVMFASQVVIAQSSYPQTGFTSYGRPQVSGLSAAATRPPAFSDTSADASAMSPNSWGESAIRNPFAGYANTPNAISSTATSAPVFVQQQTQSLPALTSAPTSAPTPTPAAPAESALTNTDYSRTTERPDRYADASFLPASVFKIKEPSALPKVEFPGKKAATEALSKTPFEIPPLPKSGTSPSASLVGVTSPEISSANSVVAQPLETQPQLAPSQPFTSQPFVSQPFVSQQGYPVFSPTQDQPAYVLGATQTTPNFSAQPSSLISNEVGFNFPQFGQMQNETFLQTPMNTFGQGFGPPTYRPNVAHRSSSPTARNQSILDQGELFDNENKKKEFPPFREIIASGKFFAVAEVAYLRPHFLGNTAISIDGPSFSESIPFDFDNEPAPFIRAGFESKYGPGFELNYFNINANSENIAQTFDGISPITSIASVTGPNRFTALTADGIGETLNANHSFEIEQIGFNVFKDIEFKVSRIGGQFGFTYANIAQSLENTVNDGGGAILDSLNSTSDFRGFGPQLGINYYRPVGHTPLEFLASFSGLGLFGRRDQFVDNTQGVVERRFGADEFIAMLDLTAGIQYKKTIGEDRHWFARLGFKHQTWLGGGTAVDPTGDFGLKGLTFGVGYNR